MSDANDCPSDDIEAPIPSALRSKRSLWQGVFFSGSIHGSILALILFGFPILHLVIERESTVASLAVVSDPQESTKKFGETNVNDNNLNDDKMRKGGSQFLADDPSSKKIPVEKSNVPTTLGGASDDQNPTEGASHSQQGDADFSSDTEGIKKSPRQSQNPRDAVAPKPISKPPTRQSQQAASQNKPAENGPSVILANAETLNKDRQQTASDAVKSAESQTPGQNSATKETAEPSQASPSQIAATANRPATPRADAGPTNQNPGQTAQSAATATTSAAPRADAGAAKQISDQTAQTAAAEEPNASGAGSSVTQNTAPTNPNVRSQSAPFSSNNRQAPNVGSFSVPSAPKAETRIAPPSAPNAVERASSGLPPPKTPSEVVDRLAEALPRIAAIRAGIFAARKRPPGAMVAAADSSQSIDRLEKFAEQGYGHAQFALAEMLLTGEGLPRDPVRGKELATKAALNGYLPAQLLLGAMAADGGSTDQPRDLGEAHAWLTLAASNDSKPAAEAVKALNSMMDVKDVIKSKQRQAELRQVSVMLSPQTKNKLSAKEAGDKLRQAAALGDLETVTVMLAQGADADSADEDGRTALIEASWRGYANIVATLIQQGANVGQVDASGKSPLMWAAINGYASVAHLLLDAGQNPNLQDSAGVTALMRAAWNDRPAVVKALLDKGADPNLKDKDGLTALDYAVRYKHPDDVFLLQGVTK